MHERSYGRLFCKNNYKLRNMNKNNLEQFLASTITKY